MGTAGVSLSWLWPCGWQSSSMQATQFGQTRALHRKFRHRKARISPKVHWSDELKARSRDENTCTRASSRGESAQSR
eukprot:4511677-Pleurochrysis_carterae.AAC.1